MSVWLGVFGVGKVVCWSCCCFVGLCVGLGMCVCVGMMLVLSGWRRGIGGFWGRIRVEKF